MRLLLDEHLSGRHIGQPLREDGHDVVAVADDPVLEGLADEWILGFAATEGRILITHDVGDYVPLLQRLGATGNHHAGCVLIRGIGNGEFGRLLAGLRTMFEERPDQDEWIDLVLWLTPGDG